MNIYIRARVWCALAYIRVAHPRKYAYHPPFWACANTRIIPLFSKPYNLGFILPLF